MNLETAVRSLLEQFPAGERPDLVKRQERLERFGRIAFGGFGLVLLLGIVGIIYGIVIKLVLTGERPLVGALLIAFVIFAALSLAYVMFAEDLKDRRNKAARTTPKELGVRVVTGKLLDEGNFEPIPTVTENTTDLLPSRNRER
jgi:hypothetical protein